MNATHERYSPTKIFFTEEEIQPSEEKIGSFLEEFPWLKSIVQDVVGEEWRLTAILTHVRIARMHVDVGRFTPALNLSYYTSNRVLDAFVENKFPDDSKFSFLFYAIDLEGKASLIPVGVRKKWVLVSRPRWFAPWRKYRIEWKDKEFFESIEHAVKRTGIGDQGMQYLLELFICRKKGCSPKLRAIIFRMPKGKEFLSFIKEDESMRKEEGRIEIRSAVSTMDV